MRKANAGGQLQDLTLKVGDWTPPWDGPLYFPPWLESRKAEVLCTEADINASGKLCKMQVSRGYWPPMTNQWESDGWIFEDLELDLADSDGEQLNTLADLQT